MRKNNPFKVGDRVVKVSGHSWLPQGARYTLSRVEGELVGVPEHICPGLFHWTHFDLAEEIHDFSNVDEGGVV